MEPTQKTSDVLAASALLEYWQGHRRLTRRTIDLFPEEKLFSFSVGSMRPFSEMVVEFLQMGEPVVSGVATGRWKSSILEAPKTKAALLALWDKDTTAMNEVWAQIPPHRFAEVDNAFGKWENWGINTILYCIDNEIHHRGQAYVYLRAMGIEPSAFWERSYDSPPPIDRSPQSLLK